MSVSVTIKNQIKSKVQGCSSVDQTYGYEEVNPKGWPCVMITPGNMQESFLAIQKTPGCIPITY